MAKQNKYNNKEKKKNELQVLWRATQGDYIGIQVIPRVLLGIIWSLILHLLFFLLLFLTFILP